MKPRRNALRSLLLLVSLAPVTSLSAQRSPQAKPNPPAQPAAPASSSQDQLPSQLAQVQETLNRKDYTAAIAMLQNIVAQSPDEPVPHFQLGYAYSELKDYDHAAVEYRRAIALDDAMAPAHLNLGLVLRDSDPAAAVASFRRAAALMPGDARPHSLAGDALEHSGHPSEAIEEYRSATTLAPKDAATWMALGDALLTAGRAAEAEAQFRQAVSLQGGTQAWLFLAKALLQEDKGTEAADALASYLKDAPNDSAARLDRASVLQTLHRSDESLAELDRLEQEAAPTPQTLKLRANIYIQQKQWMEAIPILDRAISGSPNDAQLYAWLGQAQVNLRDLPAAQAALRHSLDLDPTAITPLRELINAYYFAQQWQLTLAALDALAKRQPPAAPEWLVRASCYDRLGQLEEALDAYQKFLDLDANAHPDQDFNAELARSVLLRRLRRKK